MVRKVTAGPVRYAPYRKKTLELNRGIYPAYAVRSIVGVLPEEGPIMEDRGHAATIWLNPTMSRATVAVNRSARGL